MKPVDPKRWFARESRGQVMVTFALFLTVLISFIALSLDVGNILAERRGVQNAVDAAAMAAGRLILLEETDDLETQAQRYVDINGYDGNEALVTFPYEGNDNEVAVEITQDVPGFFLSAFYDGPWRVSAKAVAAVIEEVIEIGLLALGERDNCSGGAPVGDIVFGGNSHLNIQGAVMSNANIVFNGNSTTGEIDGSVEAHCEVQDIPENLQVDEENIQQGVPKIADPFGPEGANLVPPVCPTAPAPVPHPDDPSNHLILSPGRYTGNVNKTYISLKPGIYCFEGTLQANGFIKSFYNTTGDPPQPDDYDKVRDDDNGGVLLYFGSSGRLQMPSGHLAIKTIGSSYENIVIWYANCNHTLSITGNDETWIRGSIYGPCAEVRMTGNSTNEIEVGAVIAQRIVFTGTPTFNFRNPYTHQVTPERVYLIE